jgi:hypothetical protein
VSGIPYSRVGRPIWIGCCIILRNRPYVANSIRGTPRSLEVKSWRLGLENQSKIGASLGREWQNIIKKLRHPVGIRGDGLRHVREVVRANAARIDDFDIVEGRWIVCVRQCPKVGFLYPNMVQDLRCCRQRVPASM